MSITGKALRSIGKLDKKGAGNIFELMAFIQEINGQAKLMKKESEQIAKMPPGELRTNTVKMYLERLHEFAADVDRRAAGFKEKATTDELKGSLDIYRENAAEQIAELENNVKGL